MTDKPVIDWMKIPGDEEDPELLFELLMHSRDLIEQVSNWQQTLIERIRTQWRLK